MLKLFLIIGFFLIAYPKNVFAQMNSAMLKENQIFVDQRSVILSKFLVKYQSPLAIYAQDFVRAADYYQIDWRLVTAITGIESTFGKRIPPKSYNAYGWNNGNYSFSSWNDSIWHVTEILSTKYLNKGAKTIPQIAKIYAPPSKIWSVAVTYFIAEIDRVSLLDPSL